MRAKRGTNAGLHVAAFVLCALSAGAWFACEDGVTPNCADAAAGCYPNVEGGADSGADSGVKDATLDTGVDTGIDTGVDEDASDAAEEGDGS